MREASSGKYPIPSQNHNPISIKSHIYPNKEKEKHIHKPELEGAATPFS